MPKCRMTGPVVGLFGISGVGKTWLASRITAARPDILHLSASSLLKQAHRQSGEALRTASSSGVQANQHVLADAVVQARIGHQQQPVLLDAHSVIDNDAGLVDVPFEALAPIGIAHYIFLCAEPRQIMEQRLADTRVRPERSIAMIKRDQGRALDVCQGYARTADVPFMRLETAMPDENVGIILRTFETLAFPSASSDLL